MRSSARIAALSAVLLITWGGPSFAQVGKGQPAGKGRGEAAPGKVTRPPKLVKFQEAPYPESERATGKPASVVLTIGIGADGRVVDATVVTSAGEAFDAAAVEAVKAFEFEPAEIDGVPAPVKIQYRYDFVWKPAEAAPAPTTADFGGVVRERKTHAPLSGVTVSLDAATQKTDENGRFRFEAVTPGTHSVTLSGPGFTPVGTEETIEVGHKYDATYDVEVRVEKTSPEEQVDFEIVVVDTVLEKAIAATTVSAEQGARVAGTGGDVIKVVENLPGVARSTVGSGALVVWGAGAGDTRTYVDDVHIPVLYHEGGFRSVIHSDLVKSVELEPGGYGSPHGRGLGGLVNVGLRPLDGKGYHGSVGVDAIDAAASVRGPITDKIRFAGAFRRSHLDWVLSRVTSSDVGSFVPIPKYWDGQVRLAWVPREGESLEVGTLLSSDSISRSLVEADPADNKIESKSIGFQRVYARYERKFEDGSTATVTPFVGGDFSNTFNRFGAVPARLDSHSVVYGTRASWTGRPAEFVSIGTGLDIEVVRTSLERSGAVTSPPREGDIRVFGQAPADQVNSDQWQATVASLSPYVQTDFALLGDKLHLIPGVRFEPSVVTASRVTPATRPDAPAVGTVREDAPLEPRLAARWAVTEDVKIRAAFGIYHQPPLSEDLSATFGNPKLGPGRAMHYVLGAAVHVTKPITVEATGFYSRQSDLVTRSPLPTPVVAQALIQDGLGRAYGAQLLLRYDLTGRFFGWLSYTIMRSERTDGGSRSYRLFDLDQTHVLTALASYDLGLGFEVGARFRYSTGYPRTPIAYAVVDARTGTLDPVFGAHNSIRIPDFYQLDARVAKRWKLGGGTEVEAYLDVQNVTYHKNPEEIVYNFDYTKKSYITGLPVLPVIGGKLTW